MLSNRHSPYPASDGFPHRTGYRVFTTQTIDAGKCEIARNTLEPPLTVWCQSGTMSTWNIYWKRLANGLRPVFRKTYGQHLTGGGAFRRNRQSVRRADGLSGSPAHPGA